MTTPMATTPSISFCCINQRQASGNSKDPGQYASTILASVIPFPFRVSTADRAISSVINEFHLETTTAPLLYFNSAGFSLILFFFSYFFVNFLILELLFSTSVTRPPPSWY